MTENTPDELAEAQGDNITTLEAAELLRVHPNTVRNWARAGYLTDTRVPGTPRMRLSRAEVEERAQAIGSAKVRAGLTNRLSALCMILEGDGHMTPVATRQILRAVTEHVGP